MEPLDSAKEKIVTQWNKNWFAILVAVILLVVVFTGYINAKHAEKMADQYYQRIEELEKKVNKKIAEMEENDREAEKIRVELERRLAVSGAKWEAAMKKYAEVKVKVYPTRPKDDRELLARMSSLGYKAVLR